MWCLLITYVTFLLLFFQSEGFNLDTYHPVVYDDPNPQNRSTYFGYSVLLHPKQNDQDGRITVGSPKSTNPTISQRERTGAIYDCPFMKKCQVNVADSQEFKKLNDEKDESWIGGSMDISPEYHNWAVSGFRWKQSPWSMPGASYWFNVTTRKTFVITPFDDQRRKNSGRFIWYGLAEAGFATHIPNTVDPELILGAPGVFNWGGSAVKVKLVEKSQPPANRRSVDGRNRRGRNRAGAQIEVYKAAGSRIDSDFIQHFDLFGYSLTSGYFYGKNNTIYYVSGSPRATSYKGKVTVFRFREEDEKPLLVKEVKEGSQLGEYFGASLAAGDINGDGYDDLIVGAPFHKIDLYNEGTVYVFYGGKLLTGKEDNIPGTTVNGQFGATIMFLGDNDHDGYGDVAIAAPFEDEQRGALYIYKGSSSTLESHPSQIILGRNVFEQLRGFGVSISRPADIDNNGYKDIAVGAHISGHVVVLRSYPIVEIKSTLESYSPTLERTAVEVVFKACSEYAKFAAKKNISVSRSFEVESGSGVVYSSYEKSRNLTINLNSGTPLCENISVQINNSKSGVLIPIRARLLYKLIEERKIKNTILITNDTDNSVGNDTFCSDCPILVTDKSTAQIITKTVPFVLTNGEDNECNSTLEVTWQLFNLTDKGNFVLGSQDFMGINFEITNRGLKTYNPAIEIILPENVRLRQRLDCDTTNNESVLLCRIGISLEANEPTHITLDLDMKKLRNDPIINVLKIFIKALTCGQNVGNNTNTNFAVPLTREADITISGQSGEQSYPFEYLLASNASTDEKRTFTQIYKVDKFGASSIELVLIKIAVPYAIRTSTELTNLTQLYRPEGSFNGHAIMSCGSNFTYAVEEKIETPSSDGTDIANENVLDDSTLKDREKREAANTENNDKIDVGTNQTELTVLPNMTFYINCSNPMVMCFNIECRVGPFENSQQQAEIRLKMLLNVRKELLGLNTVVLFATEGTVSVISPSNLLQSGQRPDSIQITSIFVSETVFKSKVASWIIPVGASVGLILLILVILALCKVGFFKRSTKEQLMTMKAEAKEEDEILENMMADVQPMDLEPMEIPEDAASTEVLTDSASKVVEQEK